ncbi:hypothetical protein F5J12DRAFT_908511 [Pisolithus orientalis]|uniref:uncharacterized protein n=1 Tax=Pisolithus orientalis TaxID=936130 RepID=UPI002224F01B|nr:uncharacterized protein F5J12DRAFT_908511 [Pisolithus orientalis]KAI5981150.1 hypothetical protein F5J12DRAFT_908511 [Pisolithus orientalis]
MQPSLFSTLLTLPLPVQQHTLSVGPIRSQSLRVRQVAQPGTTFRWSAKRYFLTYTQIGDRPSDMVREFFKNCNPKPLTWKAAVESHQDGGKHWHIIVQFDQVIQSRRVDLFNIDGLHLNEEGAEVFGPWQGPSGNAEVQDLKEGKHDERFVYICSATTRDNFEDSYESKWMEFPRLPAVLAEWVSGEMKNPDHLKTLCVWGPSQTGKTEWARSLGLHIYMNGQLNAAKLFELDGDQEPEYLVLDDMDIDCFWSIKEFFGVQREFEITDNSNTVVYNLDHPLYNDAAPPNPPPVVPTLDLGEPIVWVPTPPPVLHHPQPVAAPMVYLEDLYPNWPRLRN